MNGGLSVAGTALAWIIGLASGFRVLLMAVMVLYLVVAWLSPFNELEDKPA